MTDENKPEQISLLDAIKQNIQTLKDEKLDTELSVKESIEMLILTALVEIKEELKIANRLRTQAIAFEVAKTTIDKEKSSEQAN